jgi:hypothetical protein
MKWCKVVCETSMIRAMEAFETRFWRRARISPSLPSSFDLLRAPLGRPSRLPRAFAAAKPSLVRSAIRSRSISAKSPKRLSDSNHENIAHVR